MAVHAYNPNLLMGLEMGESLEFTHSRSGSTACLDTGHK